MPVANVRNGLEGDAADLIEDSASGQMSPFGPAVHYFRLAPGADIVRAGDGQACRTPRRGIGDPAVDIGFPPACAVDADPELGRECAFADLAVDGGSGQAGTGKNGFQADDPVWFAHGCAASR